MKFSELLANSQEGSVDQLRKLGAFTLAEVLVTLGIIGVVSALTLPTLTKNHQKKTAVVQLHKIYNDFQQGLAAEMNNKNAVNLIEAGLNSASRETFLKSNFKIVKDCGTGSGCFASTYRAMGDSGATASGINNSSSYYKVTLASGASVAMRVSNISSSNANTTSFGSIYVDTNGLQGPNVAGRDYFRMYIYADGVLDDYLVSPNCRQIGGSAHCNGADSPQALRERDYQTWCGNPGDTDGCFGKLLNDNWVMSDDYENVTN